MGLPIGRSSSQSGRVSGRWPCADVSALQFDQRAPVVVRHHLDEAAAARCPSRPAARAPARCRCSSRWRSIRMRSRSASKRSRSPMPLSSADDRALARPARTRPPRRIGRRDRLQLDHRPGCTGCSKRAVRVVDIGDAARHAGGEVAPGLAQHHHHAAGHVFAAVVAAALDHRDRAGVAHREALAGDALEIRLAGDRAVQHRVADDDVLRRIALRPRRLAHDDAAARQALADIVVGVAGQLQRHAARQEGAEALPGGAGEG